jgi:alpha-beta hydrolase superfamily lysophospholipase
MIQKRKILVGLLVCVLGGISAALVGSLMVGSQLSAPVPQSVPPPPAHLHLEPMTFPSSDGGIIRGWDGHAHDATACVLLLHGVRSHRGDMLSRAEFLMQHRFSVLLIDFQAHGESSGEAITFGDREAANVDAAVAFVRSRTPHTPLVALGFSLGGAASVLSASVQEFDGLILEAVYPTIEQAIANRLRMRLGPLGAWLTPLLTGQLAWRLHVTPQHLAPQHAIQRVICPVLIIGGVDDQRTRQEDTEALFHAVSAPKELWLIPNVAHENFHHAVAAEYEQRSLTFLSRLFPVSGQTIP